MKTSQRQQTITNKQNSSFNEGGLGEGRQQLSVSSQLSIKFISQH